MEIECLRSQIQSGDRTYPVYIGFARAEDIAKVAVAPAFSPETPHQEIADNISEEPVRDWQRPLSADRTARIADAFNNTGALMPNPVLLANNAFASGVQVEPKFVQGFPTNSFTVRIDETTVPEAQRPLWILDGQHRINGLGASLQRDNLVPLVLLISDSSGSYSSPDLAKIFAQVTTAAEKLDELHNEWLTYAFSLGRYADMATNASAARRAFACVVELCRAANWNGVANPFFNRIQFNNHQSAQAAHGGFAYRCNELAARIQASYYARPANGAHLAPAELAQELARAYLALHTSIRDHATSVFFGNQQSQQHIMQDAYFVGVLSRTLREGSTADYRPLLQRLNFQNTNWNFAGWIRNLGGRANTTSKRIAQRVLDEAMTTGALPMGSGNIADHLKGNGASVTFAFSQLTAARNPSAQGRILHDVLRGSSTSVTVGTNPHMKLYDQTSNVGQIKILDQTRPLVEYNRILSPGLILDDSLPRPLNIIVDMQHYGGLSSQADLQVNW